MKRLFRYLIENLSLIGIALILFFIIILVPTFIIFPAVAIYTLQVIVISLILSFIVIKVIIPADDTDINRNIARLLKKNARRCKNVYIMGHKRPDFDSFGSCMGIYSICKRYNKNTKVIVGLDRFAIKEIYDKFIFGGYEDAFIDVFAAEQAITEDDLIILCDTHSARIAESVKVFAAAGKRIVIDHHRENEAPVENCRHMFVFPEYSSCSEIVTSVTMSFFSKPKELIAEALLAGIMVDTRNFGINSDEHTFSAAAFLCRCGVDSVEARNLFKSSIELERAKANAVESVEIYREGIVFSLCDSNHKNVYLACARAADEIIEIKNIDASIVFCQCGGTVYVSARSSGKIDVNNILKRVGGGGHITSAGTQLENTDMIQAEEMLKKAVDGYLLEVENK